MLWEIGSDLHLLLQARVMADLAVRMLQGERPADMPLRSFEKSELAVNPKAARALGATMPPALLVRADDVIE
jgi:putative ABC transport system substrate-binding protein